jgi:Mn2+/Fe2+ NRAMP family transporter
METRERIIKSSSRETICSPLQRWSQNLRRYPRIRTFLKFIAILGPGLITINAGNDSGGIATYSTVGAQFGMKMLWILFLITISLIVVQLMCARLGVFTAKGLADLIREQFGVRITTLVMLSFVIASLGTTTAEFAGIAAGFELFGISRYLSVPLAAAAIWWLVVRGSFRNVEHVFLAMTFVFFAYPISAILAKPDWAEVARGTFVPTLSLDHDYVFLAVTLIGTTITSYMQFFLQATIVEKGAPPEEYSLTKGDVIFSAIFGDLIAFFIIVATGTTLFPAGIHIESAEDAARALAPIAGPYAEALFAVGLVGASLLAAGVLPLATAYAVCEAFGFERGISHGFSEAPVFLGIYTGMIVIGAAIALIPGTPLISILILSQFLDGLLLPVLLVAIIALSNRRRVLGEHVNSPAFNLIAWATTIVLIFLSVLVMINTVFPHLF